MRRRFSLVAGLVVAPVFFVAIALAAPGGVSTIAPLVAALAILGLTILLLRQSLRPEPVLRSGRRTTPLNVLFGRAPREPRPSVWGIALPIGDRKALRALVREARDLTARAEERHLDTSLYSFTLTQARKNLEVGDTAGAVFMIERANQQLRSALTEVALRADRRRR